MSFREDTVPECRSTAHPPHTDRRRWMKVVREEPDYVVWCCQRCTEITQVYAIQVQILPRGRARGRYALGPQEAEKHRLLGSSPRHQLPTDVATASHMYPQDESETRLCGRCGGTGGFVFTGTPDGPAGKAQCPVCQGSGILIRCSVRTEKETLP